MENYRKIWMQRQTPLRQMLESANPQSGWLELLLSQHAMLHSYSMAGSEPWSYEDEVLDGLSEEKWRQVPRSGEHSVVWMIWHIARIEDTAMNLLVAGESQVFDQDGWAERLKACGCTSANELDGNAIAALSTQVDIQALRDYRRSVGRHTRQIIQGLGSQDLKRKVDPARIQKVLESGAIDELARYVTDYWSKRTVAGLLLMPATRHNFVHLNEAADLVRKS